jgi:hypothetical protein
MAADYQGVAQRWGVGGQLGQDSAAACRPRSGRLAALICPPARGSGGSGLIPAAFDATHAPLQPLSRSMSRGRRLKS